MAERRVRRMAARTKSVTFNDARALADIAYAAGNHQTGEAAQEVLDRLQGRTHCDAAAMIAWDPAEDLHRVVRSFGYGAEVLEALGDRYAQSEPAARMRRDRAPLRIDDLPYDYRATEMYQEVIEPSGFQDGMTSLLYAADGGYAGMVHFSAERPRTFDEQNRDFLAAIGPVLGELADLRRHRSSLAPLEDVARVTLFDSSGRLWPVDRFDPALSATHASFAHFAQAFVSSSAPSVCGVWPSQVGWLSLRVERVRDPIRQDDIGLMVIETPWSAPYGLSARELDILNGMATGASNQRIASERDISIRTVTTHVERILVKLGQESRAGAATKASREGLLRLDVWDQHAARVDNA